MKWLRNWFRKPDPEVVWTPERLRAEARMFARSGLGSWQEWLRLDAHEKAALAEAGTAVASERILGFIQAFGSEDGAVGLFRNVDGGQSYGESLLGQAVAMAAGNARRVG